MHMHISINDASRRHQRHCQRQSKQLIIKVISYFSYRGTTFYRYQLKYFSKKLNQMECIAAGNHRRQESTNNHIYVNNRFLVRLYVSNYATFSIAPTFYSTVVKYLFAWFEKLPELIDNVTERSVTFAVNVNSQCSQTIQQKEIRSRIVQLQLITIHPTKRSLYMKTYTFPFNCQDKSNVKCQSKAMNKTLTKQYCY